MQSAVVDPSRGRWRRVRVAVLGGSSMLLSVGAHLAGGGRLPDPGLLLVTAVGIGLLAAAVTAHRCPGWLIAAVLGLEQVGLHLLFEASTTMPTCLTTASAGHIHQAVSLSCSTPGAHPDAHTSGSMILAHLIALAATAWLLTRAEDWLWSVSDRVVRYAAAQPSRPRPRFVCLIGSALPPAYAPIPIAAAPTRGPPLG